MPSFFKTLTVFVAVASASAKATLPAIGSLDETHCPGGKVTEASHLDPEGEVVKTTVSCPNGIPSINATASLSSRIDARQNNVCGMGCTPTSCFSPPDPTSLDCDNLILFIQNNPGTFLAGASTTTQYSIGTCTCAFLSAVTQFECNASMAAACRGIQSACSSGPGVCFSPTIQSPNYEIGLLFNP
ncbi:hypothetical protein DFH08DRAFT_941419 [Mycena albidolilacea]|uniref:Uncharacterized protein n=1 Tax=Mycena albidolilacea TaxID=1033008 RepID=A0AAD7EIQ1_9AGAR|nr:hypothetical protein DFH08DRAFT_941419 [Mycena albidolilacea]